MRRFLLCAGLFLGLVLAGPAQAGKPEPFPTNSIKARLAIQDALSTTSTSLSTALESRAGLQQLATVLSKRYSEVPPLSKLKGLLVRMEGSLRWEMQDPDRAPLRVPGVGTAAFARQDARDPNPDLAAVTEQTWPETLSNGEKVALQVYSGSGASMMNRALHTSGSVPPSYALVHDRLQSAFRKARPFSPPIDIARGVNLTPALIKTFIDNVKAAQKDNKPYVMPGYVSTTYGPKVLPGWASALVHVHIKAVHALDVYPVSLFPTEKEVLLNHNCSYRVTGVKQEGPRWIVNLEQLPPGKEAKKATDKEGAKK